MKSHFSHAYAPFFSIVIATVLLAFSATPEKAAQERPSGLSQVIAGIVHRTADLNYISEQDSAVFSFYRPTPVKKITDSTLLGLLNLPAGTPVTTQSATDFLARQARNDPTGRWRRLQEYLEANATNLAVYRVSRPAPYEHQYDLFVVGLFDGTVVVGIQMFGVAT